MKTLITISAVFVSMLIQAQSIERSVISALGMSYDGENIQCDATVGEVAITTGYNNDIIITQGFIQPPPNSCLGDFDQNGVVNIVDLLIFTSTFGCVANCGITDLDNNGVVNIADLLIFTSLFGTICP